MKNIDIKSLIIGALFTSTIFLGVAATGPNDKWDKEQVWHITEFSEKDERAEKTKGWEPTGQMRVRKVPNPEGLRHLLGKTEWMATYRRRIK